MSDKSSSEVFVLLTTIFLAVVLFMTLLPLISGTVLVFFAFDVILDPRTVFNYFADLTGFILVVWTLVKLPQRTMLGRWLAILSLSFIFGTSVRNVVNFHRSGVMGIEPTRVFITIFAIEAFVALTLLTYLMMSRSIRDDFND